MIRHILSIFCTFLLFLIFLNFIYWSIIALQCDVGLCCTSTQTIYIYIYIYIYMYVCLCVCMYMYIRMYISPLSWDFLIPSPFYPSRSSQTTRLGSIYSSFPPVAYFTYDSVYMSMLLSWFILAASFSAVSISPLSMSASPFLLYR